MTTSVYTVVHRGGAYLRSWFHPRTLIHAFVALFRGIYFTFRGFIRFVNADSKKELLQSNASKHHQETEFRRYLVVVALVFWVAIWTYICLAYPRGYAYPIVFHIILFIAIGRTEPLMIRVETAKMVGEALLRAVVDEITLTEAARKNKFTSTIAVPPSRIRSNKGYECVVQVSDKGAPEKILESPQKVAQKLHRGESCVFVSSVKHDASQVRILVLDHDPWAERPTISPIVAKPRQVDLWVDQLDMGTRPDYTQALIRLVEEGDGGGLIVGGAPRRGKSVYLSGLLAWISCDPSADIYIVDGSAVDFGALRPIAADFVGDQDITDVQLLAGAHKIVKALKEEADSRKSVLFSEGVNKLSKKLALKHNLGTKWLVIDELAIITEDMLKTNKEAVELFLSDLQWLVRMGPKYGIFCIFATQRPSEKSIPSAIRELVINRVAFYIASDVGSRAILGKAGRANRADLLDPDQKGVAISTINGMFRAHLVETFDLERVVKFAAALRARYREHGPSSPAPEAEHPEPVKTLLEIFTRREASELETTVLVDELKSSGYGSTTDKSLAAQLKPFGIRSVRFFVNGVRLRGYQKADFERVPMIVFHPSRAVHGTGVDRTGTGSGTGGP